MFFCVSFFTEYLQKLKNFRLEKLEIHKIDLTRGLAPCQLKSLISHLDENACRRS